MSTPVYLTVGKLYFAANERAATESLFRAGGTASGTFSKRKNGVLFKDMRGEPFAFLVANPGQSKFFVSASKLGNGDNRIRYMFSISDPDAKRLGIAEMGYSKQSDEAARVWKAVNSPDAKSNPRGIRNSDTPLYAVKITRGGTVSYLADKGRVAWTHGVALKHLTSWRKGLGKGSRAVLEIHNS